jgi:dihydrodipicolinate synthase/N-acetylneuraminate lyase
MLYNIPRCVPYDIPVDVIAELARHQNIIGIKDSSGNLEKLREVLAATQTVAKRTVTVTPVFEAVTERMVLSKAEASAMDFVSAGDLSGGMALASAPPVAAMKTRNREVGFQVLTGSAVILLDAVEAGAAGGILGFAACAPQACQEVYLAWKDHDMKLAQEKQLRIAAPGKRIVGELGIAGVKYACDFNGYYGGKARLPLIGLTAAERSEIEGLLRQIRN